MPQPKVSPQPIAWRQPMGSPQHMDLPHATDASKQRMYMPSGSYRDGAGPSQEDMDSLGVLRPDVVTRITSYMDGRVQKFIERLEELGAADVLSDWASELVSVYRTAHGGGGARGRR